MKEFISDNGLTMVEGKLFNWKKEPMYYGKNEPCGYIIDMGDIGDMYSAVYMERDHNLCIYRNSDHIDFIANFYCDDIYFAETIVFAFIKASKRIDIKGTIYSKIKF